MAANSATASGLATRYATALFELALEQNKLDEVERDIGEVEAMLGESADLARLLNSPIVSREEQGRAVGAVAERAQIGDLVKNFLGVLAQKRRLFAFSAIARAFRDRLATHRGEVTAEVVSAVPLDEQQLEQLQASVGRFAGKAVSLRTAVDPGLIGGLVVRVGSRMIDASLKSKLTQLELAMRGVG